MAGIIPYPSQYEVPFRLKGLHCVPNFIARDQETSNLEESLLPKPTHALNQKVVVLHGPGGIGKTQLAIEFIRRSEEHFSSIFWINGGNSSKESVRQNFAQIAWEVPIGQIPESCRSFKSKISSEKLDEIVKYVLEWYNQPENNRWLLIFDNVDWDHSLKIDDARSYDVKDYFPEANHGSILIISRLRQLREYGQDQQLGGMSDLQAAELLRSKIGRSVEGLDRIVEKVDGVPLALALAGSYIERTASSVDDYLGLYEEIWKRLHDNIMTQFNDYPLSILCTYTISYEHVQRIDNSAARFLDLFAHLDSSDIYYSLFTPILKRTIAKKHLLPTWFLDSVETELDFSQKIQILLDYSLIERQHETSSYTIQPTIHEWCFESSRASKDETASLATSVIGSACFSIDNSADWLYQNRLIDHCSHLHFCIEKNPEYFARDKRWDPTVCFAYFSIGNFTSIHGKLKEAEAMYLRALTENKGEGGADAATFKIINNLGLLYDKLGNMEKAEEMYLRALAGKEKVGGDDIVSTLETVHNLGVFYRFEGKTEKAQEMFVRALTGKEKNLGIHHRSTLKTIHQLGTLYMNQNKPQEAETLYLRTIASVEAQGSAGGDGGDGDDIANHPLLLEIINSLAVLYYNQNKMQEAEILLLKSLHGCEISRDPNDKFSLDARYNLAVVYDETARFEDAVRELSVAVEGYVRTLGAGHRQTVQAVDLLGKFVGKMRDRERCEGEGGVEGGERGGERGGEKMEQEQEEEEGGEEVEVGVEVEATEQQHVRKKARLS